MLVAAASPEGVRGSALARAGRRHAPAPVRIGGAAGALGRLSRRRHAGVPVRRQPWRAGFLFHRDEHAHPGRASHHRGRDWRGPGARDAAHRRWRAAALAPAGYLAARRGHRMPAQCGGPAAQFRAQRAASISCAGRADRECAWIPCCIRAARYRPTIRCWPSSLSGTKTVARRWPGWRGRWTRSSWKASIPRWRCTARWRRIPRWWRATTTRTGWKPGCGRSGGAAMSVRYTHGGDEFIFAEISEDMSLESFFRAWPSPARCASARSTA